MPRSLFAGFSPVKLWNLSMVGSIVFGMMVMSLMYRYLGPNASAEQRMIAANSAYQSDRIVLSEVVGSGASLVLGSDNLNQDGDSDGRIDYISELLGDINPQSQEEMEKKEFQAKIEKMVSGYPIEKMVPYIVEKDRVVAAFLVSIAKKESDWGKRVPVLNGQDCNNYWGYRGIRRLMGSAGHTCFNSRKDAVDTVAKRIEQLVEKYGLNTPEKMIIWKCGSSCATHSDYSVRKWISDVETYFHELNGSQGDASLFDEEDV